MMLCDCKYIYILYFNFASIHAAKMFRSAAKSSSSVTLNCYDPTWPDRFSRYLVELHFKSNKAGSIFEKIATYNPSINEIKVLVPSWENTVKFEHEGIVLIQHLELTNEGTYKCKSLSMHFPFGEDLVWTTTLLVFISPNVTISTKTNPMRANSGPVEAAECNASSWPAAEVKWKSLENLTFSQSSSTDATNSGLVEASSVLRLSPTRLFDQQVFVCETDFPYLTEVETQRFVANVTYFPTFLRFQYDRASNTIICEAEGNPPVEYKWILPQNRKGVFGPKVELFGSEDPHRQIDNYICIAENSVGGIKRNITTYNALHLVTVPSYAGVIGKIIGVLALIVIAIGLGYVVCMRLGKADKKHSRYPDKAAQKVRYEKLQFGAVQQRKFDLFLRKFVRSLPSLLFFCIRR